MSYTLTKYEKETVLLYNRVATPSPSAPTILVCAGVCGNTLPGTLNCAGALISRSTPTMPSTRFRKTVCPSGFSRP